MDNDSKIEKINILSELREYAINKHFALNRQLKINSILNNIEFIEITLDNINEWNDYLLLRKEMIYTAPYLF